MATVWIASPIGGTLATLMGGITLIAVIGFGVTVRVKGTGQYWSAIESGAFGALILTAGIALLVIHRRVDRHIQNP